MLCKILIINMLDYKFKRFIFNIKLKAENNNIYQAMYKYHINNISALGKYNLQ